MNESNPGWPIKAWRKLRDFVLTDLGSSIMASVYVGLWQKNHLAGFATWFVLFALREILRASFDFAFGRLAQMMMEIMNEAINKRFGPQVVKHEVTHRHIEGKEPWE